MKPAALLLALLLPFPLAAQGPAPADWQLVWSDEFDRDGAPDPAKWDYDLGGDGWGNKELQHYTARRENARVEHGRLVLEARREPWQGNAYTSARLVTRGKADWQYARIEVRAKLPAGRGTWPAIWMLPVTHDLGSGLWPDIGEIDLMEHVGYEPGVVHGSLHSQRHNGDKGGKPVTAQTLVLDASERFHTYALEWDAEEIRIFVDDVCYFTDRKNGADWRRWPYQQKFYLILNVAVGGYWGGVKGVDESVFPARLEVDFVRVYQRKK